MHYLVSCVPKLSSFVVSKWISIFLAVIIVIMGTWIQLLKRVSLPKHLVDHPVIFLDTLIPQVTADSLLIKIKDLKSFQSNVRAETGFNPTHEHI